MPSLNGIQLRALDPKLKVLFFSVLDSTQEIMSVLPNMKLNDAIRKPIEANELVKVIKNA